MNSGTRESYIYQLVSNEIVRWQIQHGRNNLPWKSHHNTYFIWLSEIMLQQTQVSTVIPYFEKFIKKFPTIEKLANASLDEVLSLWAGLGYYARGRNLHKCAKKILLDHNGEIPSNFEKLISLPGIGKTTAHAILSQAYNLPYAILDGNAKRVLSRLHATNDNLWEIAELTMQTDENAIYTQAIMDLGAKICTRNKPQCNICPIASHCKALKENLQLEYPAKNKKIKMIHKYFEFIVHINAADEIFLIKEKDDGIWGGLWSLPKIELEKPPELTDNHFAYIKHQFTHMIWEINAIKTRNTPLNINGIWVNAIEAISMGIPKPISTIIKLLITDSIASRP